MTREEAKEMLPFIQAYAEGKAIEHSLDGRRWFETCYPSWNPNLIYRIKPERNYRPFKTQEECWNEMLKHQPIGYIKGKVQKNVVFITEISTNTHNELSFSLSISTSVYDAECLFSSYTFADGTPFGIQED